ncbi:TPA: hypothetical protein MI617_08865 [Klebsiella pneumoniae]|nr:hypothetical protein [Klebsiella pneumoniae]HBY7337563.1 hypothetical protein [Klebsiella pneumoniae]HBY7343431.1 hypothetical protein [Klebsiella pneumoniae]
MTITLQAVNELIASLESAGELSIREQKFLKLAKEFRICSASLDTAIKTGNVLADQNAQLAAENVALKSYRYTLDEIKSSLVGGGHGHMAKADMQAQGALLDVIFDAFDDIETPATDRIVAGIKADGVEEFAAKLRIPGDDQFFDALAKGVALAADDFAKQLREGAK